MVVNRMAVSAQPARAAGALFEPVGTRRAYESVIEQIVDRIRSGELREGALLPGERTLAATLEVSRPTVRMALEALAEAGVLETRRGRSGGARVISIWIPDGVLETPTTGLRADEIFQVLEARRTLEPRLAQLAALRATDADFDELRRCIALEAAQMGDWRRMVEADIRFHRQLWRMAGNAELEGMMARIIDKLGTALDMAMRTEDDKAAAVAIHEHTLAALMGGDAEAIDRVMDEHMAYLEDICADVLGRRRVREVPAFLRTSGAAGRAER